MTDALFLELSQQALWVTAKLVGPLLIVSTIVGLSVGIFQAVTQINEMTLTFIPKIVITGIVLVLLGPWMLRTISDYSYNLLTNVPKYLQMK